MDVDLKDLVGPAARKGILVAEEVHGVWTSYLDKSDALYEAVMLVHNPGTNIDDSQSFSDLHTTNHPIREGGVRMQLHHQANESA